MSAHISGKQTDCMLCHGQIRFAYVLLGIWHRLQNFSMIYLSLPAPWETSKDSLTFFFFKTLGGGNKASGQFSHGK